MYSEQRGRAIVYARSQGACEACRRPATEWHHRQNRSQGGTWSPANGLHLCSYCHRWVTIQPAHALTLGLTVARGQDPTQWPAWCHPTMWTQTWWLLDPDGMWLFVHATHPDPAGAYAAQVAFTTARGLPVPLPA